MNINFRLSLFYLYLLLVAAALVIIVIPGPGGQPMELACMGLLVLGLPWAFFSGLLLATLSISGAWFHAADMVICIACNAYLLWPGKRRT